MQVSSLHGHAIVGTTEIALQTLENLGLAGLAIRRLPVREQLLFYESHEEQSKKDWDKTTRGKAYSEESREYWVMNPEQRQA